MDLETKKKAAVSAVLALLASEQQGPEGQASMAPRTNAWGHQGRTQSMEIRNLMQLRSIGRG